MRIGAFRDLLLNDDIYMFQDRRSNDGDSLFECRLALSVFVTREGLVCASELRFLDAAPCSNAALVCCCKATYVECVGIFICGEKEIIQIRSEIGWEIKYWRFLVVL